MNPIFHIPQININITINDHIYVPLVINTFRSFPHSWLITRFVARVTRQVPLMEQELPTLPEHLSSPPVFTGFVYSIFSFMCILCISLFGLLSFFFWPLCYLFFSFGHCVVCSSIYGFWLPLWYLLTLHNADKYVYPWWQLNDMSLNNSYGNV